MPDCSTCQASWVNAVGYRECRANAPHRIITRVDVNSGTFWPIVNDADWCYQYKDMSLGDYLSSLTGGLL